mmetsp:Transcript_7917/g.17251  ORF Transcript_7917/g.17251 Transcript_7917/m.17251 type:complete len:198 (-) Transcript_7917:257-850(-)
MSSNPLPQQRTEDLAVLNAAMNLVPETYEEFKGHFSSSVSLSRKQVAGKALAELGIDPDVFYSGIAAANKPGLEEEGSSEANGGFSPAPRMALCINTNSTSSAFPSLGCPVDEFEEVGLEGEVVGGRMGRETPRGVAGSLKIDSLTDDEDLGPDDDHWLQPSLPLRDTGYRTDAVHVVAGRAPCFSLQMSHCCRAGL